MATAHKFFSKQYLLPLGPTAVRQIISFGQGRIGV
jgi:hypothetical protein